jgi:hypothetical protein
MHQDMSRAVRLPFGTSDPYPIHRGTAQGAVESPWLYSAFINGLAVALKARGFGLLIAGKRIPLLMYADDVVLLVSSQLELAQMSDVASEFARTRRFQYNGQKCGLMTFNVTAAERARAKATEWVLFGEKVKVTDSYDYLGSTTSANPHDWSHHVRALIARAKKKSADLAWMCRAGRGMRPRTAMALWNAIVRPVLEYGAEIWCGLIGTTVTDEAEAVLTSFVQSVAGVHKKGMGVSVDFLRAELGVERLTARWEKLKLGYWKRLNDAAHSRALSAILRYRTAQVNANNRVLGSRSLFTSSRALLAKHSLQTYWDNPPKNGRCSKLAWREICYEAVESTEDSLRSDRMFHLSSMDYYRDVKHWGINDKEHSVFSGEFERRGYRVPEPYLDDHTFPREVTRLKLLSRCNGLPLMVRVGRERGWPKDSCVCFACGDGDLEDTSHFFMHCPLYEDLRENLFAGIQRMVTVQGFHRICIDGNF